MGREVERLEAELKKLGKEHCELIPTYRRTLEEMKRPVLDLAGKIDTIANIWQAVRAPS
jgi:hypothetical protein